MQLYLIAIVSSGPSFCHCVKDRPSAAEMWFLGKAMRILRTAKTGNEEILRIVGPEEDY